jgi:hypothetical protein
MAVIALLMAIPVAALTGMVVLTVGAVVSKASPVVKFHTKSTVSALPAKSLAPVVIVAVYGVLGVRLLNGTNIALTLE